MAVEQVFPPRNPFATRPHGRPRSLNIIDPLVQRLTLGTALALLWGCTNLATPAGTSSADIDAGTTTSAVTSANTVEELRAELAVREARIARLETELGEDSTGGSLSGADIALFPPNAKAGECYARILEPERYVSIDERILVREAAEQVEVVPAQYERAEERVLIKEASSRLEVVPAVYETVQERILIKPASTRVVQVPATFDTVQERLLDKPAYTVWKKGNASQVDGNVLSEKQTATGEIMCLVEMPATYKTVSKQVVASPATTREVPVPAEYKTVSRSVLVSPATTREVLIPAEYVTVEVNRLLTPAREVRTPIPAEYKTVTRTEKVSDARLAWQEVLCDVNATHDNVRRLQEALVARGYPVSVDGILGPRTIRAVNRFAAGENIPQGANYVPLEVLERLDLSF